MTEKKKELSAKPAILGYIPKGKSNAISLPALTYATKKSAREARRAVMIARKAGYIIASCADGYFIPETDNELISYYKWHKRRALTALVCSEPVRKKLVAKGYKIKDADVSL